MSKRSGIRVWVDIAAPPEVVWESVADISSHVEWMADAESIEFVGEQKSRVGTRFACYTKVGPFKTVDQMEVTDWQPAKAMAVNHSGLFKGSGRFELKETGSGSGTRLTWTEDLEFPWYFGSQLGAFVARPILKRIWQSNLRRLSESVVGESRSS